MSYNRERGGRQGERGVSPFNKPLWVTRGKFDLRSCTALHPARLFHSFLVRHWKVTHESTQPFVLFCGVSEALVAIKSLSCPGIAVKTRGQLHEVRGEEVFSISFVGSTTTT